MNSLSRLAAFLPCVVLGSLLLSACGRSTPDPAAAEFAPSSPAAPGSSSALPSPTPAPAAAASPMQSANDLREMTLSQAAGIVKGSQGSPVLFHIYASWCGPCRREFPTVIQVAGKYRDRGLKVVACSVDEKRSDLEAMLSNYQLPFTPIRITRTSENDFAAAMSSIGAQYENGIPFTAIYDKSGRIAAQWTGSAEESDYDREIAPLL